LNKDVSLLKAGRRLDEPIICRFTLKCLAVYSAHRRKTKRLIFIASNAPVIYNISATSEQYSQGYSRSHSHGRRLNRIFAKPVCLNKIFILVCFLVGQPTYCDISPLAPTWSLGKPCLVAWNWIVVNLRSHIGPIQWPDPIFLLPFVEKSCPDPNLLVPSAISVSCGWKHMPRPLGGLFSSSHRAGLSMTSRRSLSSCCIRNASK